MKIASHLSSTTPRVRIRRTAYLLGCTITVALWALVIVIAAALA